jgi:hypothetical protein
MPPSSASVEAVSLARQGHKQAAALAGQVILQFRPPEGPVVQGHKPAIGHPHDEDHIAGDGY